MNRKEALFEIEADAYEKAIWHYEVGNEEEYQRQMKICLRARHRREKVIE